MGTVTLVLGGPHTWPTVCCPAMAAAGEQEIWDNYSPSHLWRYSRTHPLQIPDITSYSWYSPTLLLRGQLVASGRASGSSSDGVQVTLGCRGCSRASQHSPAHPGITAGLQHQLQTQPGLVNQTIYPAPLSFPP